MTDAVSIKVDAATVIAELNVVMNHVTDLSPVLGGAVNKGVDSLYLRMFASEGAFGGQRWRSLAPVSIILRGRRGHGRGGIGQDTNRMWASLTKGGLGPEALKVVTPTSLDRGTLVPYAKWFAGGWNSRTFVVVDKNGNPVPLRRKVPKRIPGRPLLPDPIPSPVLTSWETMIARFVTNGA